MLLSITMICAGVCLFGCLHHLRVAWWVGRPNENLLLAGASLAFGGFCLFSGASFLPLSPRATDLMLRGVISCGAAGVLLQAWFVQQRLGEARTAMLWISAYTAVGILVNLTLTGGLVFEPFTEVVVRAGPSGELRTLPDAAPSRVGAAVIILVLVAPAAALVRPILRAESRGEAIALLVALLTPMSLLGLLVLFLPPGGPSVPWGPIALASTTLLLSAVAAYDLGDRQRVERATRRDLALARALVETAPEAIGVFDVGAQRFVAVNDRAERLLGRSRTELISSAPETFYAGSGPDAQARVEQAEGIVERVLAGETVTVDWQVVLPDGSETPTELRAAAARHGTRTLIRTSLLDMSEREARRAAETRIAEELRAAEEAENLGRLAGGIAHDLNNLLVPVLGFGDMALDDAGEHPGRVHLEEMLQAAGRSSDLARRVLLLGRSDVPAPSAVPFGPAVRRAMEVVSATLPTGVELEVADVVRDVRVLAEEQLFQRVLVDVGTHALLTVPPDGRMVLRTTERDDRMELVMACPGGQLPDAIRDRLFEPFGEGESKRQTASGEGDRAEAAARAGFDGLGLSIARGVVVAWGGRLDVSADEHEVTWRLVLPKAEADTDRDASSPAVGE